MRLQSTIRNSQCAIRSLQSAIRNPQSAIRIGLLIGVLAPLAMGQTSSVPARPLSAYESLDESRLVDRLAELQMAELMDAYAKGAGSQADQGKALRFTVTRKLAQAESVEDSLARDAMIDEAVTGLRQLIEMGKDGVTDTEILRLYDDRFDLGAALALTKVTPYAQRMLYLQGGPGDAQKVLDSSQDGLTILDDVIASASQKVEKWRGDSDMLAIGATKRVEEFVKTARYKAAWARFYRGLALETMPAAATGPASKPDDERAGLLRETIAAVAEYTQGDASTGVKFWSLLLSGMAARELGQADNAAAFLTAATVSQAEPQVQMQAMFELAKLQIQQKQWARAETQVAQFRQRGVTLLGEKGAVGVDLQWCFLTNYLYRQQALDAQATSPDQARMLQAKAQQQFVDFLEKYPDYQRAFCMLIGQRYADEEDLGKLDGLIVLAKGLALMRGPTPDIARAIQLLQEVLNRTDASSLRVRPLAMWNLATALYGDTSRRLEAAQWFCRLTREFPDNQRATDAARNAVIILDARVTGLREGKQSIPDDLRKQYVDALELLLGRDSRDPKILEYANPLAQQYDAMGQFDQAVKWYQRVPASSADFGLAQYRALVMRIQAIRTGKADQTARREAAAAVLADLRLYADGARDQAGKMPDPQKKAVLLHLGSEADLFIAEVLKNELGQLAPALQHVSGLPSRWPEEKDVLEQAEAFRIGVLLEQGETRQAIDALRKFRQVNPEKSNALVGQVVLVIRGRIESLRETPGQERELQDWNKIYAEFAEQAYQALVSAGPGERYAYKQMWAEAMTETGKPAQGRKLYQELLTEQPADARNVEGLARSNWLVNGQNGKDILQALKYYQQLADGLDPNQYARQWWRAQLSLCQCALDAYSGDPAQLGRLGVRIRQLRAVNATFGGYLESFNVLERKVKD